MPFRPRLIQPEMPPIDEYGDLELPVDLALLAEQLQLDAERLADTYPADPLCDRDSVAKVRPFAVKRRYLSRRRRSMLIGTLASILFAAVAAPVAVWQLQHRENKQRVATTTDMTDVDGANPFSTTSSSFALNNARNVHGEALAVELRNVSSLLPGNWIWKGTAAHRDEMWNVRNSEPTVSKIGHLRDAELDLLELEVTAPIFIEL